MENENLNQEEKPTAFSRLLQSSEQHLSRVSTTNVATSTGGFHDSNVARPDCVSVPYSQTSFSSFTPVENARIHQFFPGQMPAFGISQTDISLLSGFPNPNIELNSFGISLNELPQERSYNRMWTTDTNMNNFHVEGSPQISVRGQMVEGLHMIRQGGVNNNRNIMEPRLRQNPSELAAFHTPINEENYGSTNVTYDAFQPYQLPEQLGSFLTLGSVGGTFMGYMPSLNMVGSSPSFQDNASHIRAPYQDLSGWSFVSNSPRMSSNSNVSFIPSPILHQTQLGYQPHPSVQSNVNFIPAAGADSNSNFVYRGPRGVINRYPNNPSPPLQNNQVGLLDNGRIRANNLSMASLIARHNTQLASLRHNQETGSGSDQIGQLDSEGTHAKNLSMTALHGRLNTQQASVQQNNEAGLVCNSLAESSVIPHSPSFSVSESTIKHDQSGNIGQFVDTLRPLKDRGHSFTTVAMESEMSQSSHCFHGPSLKRGAIRPPPATPRAQRHKRVIQSPSQLSNVAAINPSRPIAESEPYLASFPPVSTHNPAVTQLFRQPVPTFPSLPRAAVPNFAQSAQCHMGTIPSPSSLPKNEHNRPPLQLNTPTHHIKWKDLDETQSMGKKCFLCKRDVSLTPEGLLFRPTNPPPVAVLACGHVFHDVCLERITPPELSKNPPCIPCAVRESQL